MGYPYDEARGHFSEKELVDLTAAVIAINAWKPGRNRVSCHATFEKQKKSARGHPVISVQRSNARY